MKQRLETVSAVLVVLVIGLAWFNGREEPSQPVAASAVEAARPGGQALSALAAAHGPVQHADVPCTKERDSKPRPVKKIGGSLKEDFARVYFKPDAYPQQADVQIIPDEGRHGIKLDKVPTSTALVFLRLDYCGDEEAEAYWIHTHAGHLPAYILETSILETGAFKKRWAVAEVPPDSWVDPDEHGPQTGFVILSN